MANKNEINEKSVVALPIPVFWGVVVSLVAGTAIAATSFASINYKLDRLIDDSVSRDQFHRWEGELRDQNKHLNISVPSIESGLRGDRAPKELPPSKQTAYAVIPRKENGE